MRPSSLGVSNVHLVRFICLALVTVTICATVIIQSSTARGTDVVGDDEQDRFVGTGSLLLPPGISESGRNSAAQCPGCRWRAVQTCDPSTPTACRGAARLCPNDALWLKIYLAQPGQDWQVIGSDCFGPGGPVSRVTAEVRISETLAESVPRLRPTVRPPGGILPHLPVHVESGQSALPRQWNWQIVGLNVMVEATPSWWWRTGVSQVGPVRDPGMSFVYRDAGMRSIDVSTTWTARYWVHGIGPLAVTGQVRQYESVTFTVGEARAVLVR